MCMMEREYLLRLEMVVVALLDGEKGVKDGSGSVVVLGAVVFALLWYFQGEEIFTWGTDARGEMGEQELNALESAVKLSD